MHAVSSWARAGNGSRAIARAHSGTIAGIWCASGFPAMGYSPNSWYRRGGRPEQLFGRGGAGAAVVIPVRQVVAAQHAFERPPEHAQDLQGTRRCIVVVDLEAQ